MHRLSQLLLLPLLPRQLLKMHLRLRLRLLQQPMQHQLPLHLLSTLLQLQQLRLRTDVCQGVHTAAGMPLFSCADWMFSDPGLHPGCPARMIRGTLTAKVEEPMTFGFHALDKATIFGRNARLRKRRLFPLRVSFRQRWCASIVSWQVLVEDSAVARTRVSWGWYGIFFVLIEWGVGILPI